MSAKIYFTEKTSDALRALELLKDDSTQKSLVLKLVMISEPSTPLPWNVAPDPRTHQCPGRGNHGVTGGTAMFVRG